MDPGKILRTSRFTGHPPDIRTPNSVVNNPQERNKNSWKDFLRAFFVKKDFLGVLVSRTFLGPMVARQEASSTVSYNRPPSKWFSCLGGLNC